MTRTILHIAEAPGGVERYLVTFLTKMKKYKEFRHVLVCSSSFDNRKFINLVESITVVDEMHNSISLHNDLKSILAVRKAIKKYRPDIVYCHSSKAGAIGRVADIGFRNKLIYNAHGWSFNIQGISRARIKLYEWVEKVLALITYRIVCISEYEVESAINRKICRNNKLIVINNGIDFDEYKKIKSKTREELGIPKNAFVIGTIGRLSKQKAPDVFVEMARVIKKSIPNAFFLMVGDDISSGQYRKYIEDKIVEYGLKDSFLITGWVNNPLDYLGTIDVATLLSRWEGFGLVLPEYMFMGKPIVGTNVDAIPYVVGDAGILIEVDNYIQAANSVIKLHDDEELRKLIVDRGKTRVSLFNAERTADQHVRLFEQC